MASWTKNARTIQSSATNTSGSTTTGSTVDLSTASGGVVGWKITNGATGPTIGCTITLQYSRDNFSTSWDVAAVLAGTANNGVYSGAFNIPIGVMYCRVKFAGNTGQSVTVEAYLMEATSFA